MTRVVVLGSGYAGSAAVRSLQEELDEDADLVWVSENPYHLVLHEVHRCIRKPSVRDHVTVPVEEIADEDTEFVQGRVVDVDVEDRTVALDDETTLDYDYCVVCLGSQTAFYGIDGLEEHALTLKSLGDAMSIHERIKQAAVAADRTDPATVVVGGGGLTGIQTAGEVAALRDWTDSHIDVHLVERSGEIFPGHDHEFQGAIQNKLERHDVEVDTGKAMTSVSEDEIEFDDGDSMAYDVLVWAGGVTGQDSMGNVDVDKDHNRAYADSTFKTSDDRVFAIGDAALVNQDVEGGPHTEHDLWEQVVHPDADASPPPTAEAAMEEGKHLGQNVAREMDGRELVHWSYINKGTLVSVGDDAVAHGVLGSPVNTFSGRPAEVLKKFISARWLTKVGGVRRAVDAWDDM
ncbi:FAD-dependent oxidoreductase [Halogeometricum sp. S1BR25-6]|uniref:NADH:ubiquinone reductase (non-electrogenic) n=1 Tax=Halogeometricum salsisoli TaxID=2950536 RepID=A0ABU2GGY9_9EURY|nr:FAD-dependent oxidoreductase [Halogeometricum sp. S1BR25-6]MDS0300076.1 FAD-dependent oxidoreductase [Halogeometricum sp. S1BR25-6]